MYYPYFITYMAIGLIISIAVFFWALKHGQFNDQQRARFLPLRDEVDQPPMRTGRSHRFEIYGLFVLVVLGLCASATLLAYSLYFSK
jgi:cbb3-type cytochrome oxidase maturation protein